MQIDRKLIPIIFSVSLVLLLVLSLFLLSNSQKSDSVVNKDVATGTKGKSHPELKYEDQLPNQNIEITSYSTDVKKGDLFSISWDYSEILENYGYDLTLCLVGFTSKGKLIETMDKVDDECYYRFGGANYAAIFGKDSVDEQVYNVTVAENIEELFTEVPSYYSVQLVFLDQRPQDKTTEWAGVVGYAEAGPIYFK